MIKEIANSELEKYTANAKVLAFERHDELINMLLSKVSNLEHSLEELEKAFSTPSMQFDFYEADKAYIKSGDKNKLDMLSSIISERIRCVDETLKQIAISESIKVVPLLNEKLLDVLAFVFLLGHVTRKGIRSLDDLTVYLRRFVLPYCSNALKVNDFDIQHLDYTRCSVKSIGSKSIVKILLNIYSSAFFLPINKVEIEGVKHGNKTLAEWFPKLFVARYGQYYFNVFDRQSCFEIIEANPFGASKSVEETAKDFFQSHLPKETDVEGIIAEKDPDLKIIFDCWNKGCANLVLSSVGIAVAIIHINNKTNMGLNLDTWLS